MSDNTRITEPWSRDEAVRVVGLLDNLMGELGEAPDSIRMAVRNAQREAWTELLDGNSWKMSE
jgi:hypothetical protein